MAKTPVLLSTMAKAGFTTVHRQNKAGKEMSCIIADNNNVMGGVNLIDAKMYMYLGERKTLKWTTKAAFSLFCTATLDSYVPPNILKSHTAMDIQAIRPSHLSQ